jgi:molecular chaperone GrpE
MKTKVEKVTKDEFDSMKAELNDKYVRLYAEYDNYKRRVSKEKEEIRNMTKIETLSSILDIDNDLSIAVSKMENKPDGIDLILSKVDKYLKSQNIEIVQTEKYDPDIHEVVSVVETGQNKIVEVVSRGYSIGGKIIKYPKVILSK